MLFLLTMGRFCFGGGNCVVLWWWWWLSVCEQMRASREFQVVGLSGLELYICQILLEEHFLLCSCDGRRGGLVCVCVCVCVCVGGGGGWGRWVRGWMWECV